MFLMKHFRLYFAILFSLSFFYESTAQILFSEDFNENGTTGTSNEGIGWNILCPSCIAASVVQSNGTEFIAQETNDGTGPASFITDNIDISTCSKLIFTFDYDANTDYPGSGNLEAASECPSCNGVPLGQNGPCGTCWDFIYAVLELDGVPAATQIIGATTATPQSGTITLAPPCFLPGSKQNAVIKIYVQTINNVEIFYIDNVKLECITTQIPNINVAPSLNVCEGQNVNFSIIAPWINPMWTGPGGFTSTISNPQITNITAAQAGDYVLVSTNAANCANEATVTINVNPAPEVTVSGNGDLCQGDCSTMTFNVNGGTPPFNVNVTFQYGSLPVLPIPLILPSVNETIEVCYSYSLNPPLGLPTYDIASKTLTIPANAENSTGSLNLISISDAIGCPGTVNGSINFNFLEQSQASPSTLFGCDDGSGQVIFNLEDATPSILGTEVGLVTFFTDVALTNEVFSPYSSNGEVLYAIITNPDGCESIPVPLTLDVKPKGDVGPVSLSCMSSNSCKICDSDGILGEDIQVSVNLPGAGPFVVEIISNIGGNIATQSFNLSGPIALVNYNINADAIFIVTSVIEGIDCPDFTGLGGPLNISYDIQPNVGSIGLISSCAPITLQPFNVTNPSGITGYYSGQNGTGTLFNGGDIISTSTKLYAFSGTPDCYDQETVNIVIGGITTYAEPKDTMICGQYILPQIQGTGVSSLAGYFSMPSGMGVKFNTGDTIKSSTTLYIFEPTNPTCQTNNPDLKITITTAPQIKLDSVVFACNSYKLPLITGINLTGNQAYYSTPNFTGLKDTVGTIVAITDTFYLFDGTSVCSDKDTLIVNIQKNTSYNIIANVTACNSYELPPIQGVNVGPNVAYYTSPNGKGNLLNIGDVVLNPITLYVYDTINKCQTNFQQFNIAVAPGPEIFPIDDTIVCEVFTLPSIKGTNLSTKAYYTGPNGSGQKYAEGLVISSPGIIYAYEANSACATEKSFNLKIEKKPLSGLGKIVGLCDNVDDVINLFDLLTGPFDTNGTWSGNPSLDLSDPTKVKIPNSLGPNSYGFSYFITPQVCPTSTTLSTLVLVAKPNAGMDSILSICQGSTAFLNLFSILKNPSSNTGLITSQFAITDPTKINVANLGVGKYEIKYKLLNTNTASSTTCADSALVTININAGANAGSNAFRSVCNGAVVELKDMISGQTSIGIFKEKTNTGKLTGSQFNTTGLNAGFFTIYHILPANGSCKADTSELSVEVKNLISAGSDVEKTYCDLKPIDLKTLVAQSNSGGKFNFSGPGGTLTALGVFTPSQANSFLIKYVVGDGVICPIDEAEIKLTFISKPTIDLVAQPTICNGQDLLLSLNGQGNSNFDVIIQNESQYNAGNLNVNVKKETITNLNGNKTINIVSSLLQTNVKYFVSIKKATIDACSFDLDIVKQFSVLASPTKQIKGKYCEGQLIIINGVVFNENKPKDTLFVSSPIGCDSVLYVDLLFNKPTFSDFNFTTCRENYSYKIGGKIFDKNQLSGSALLGIKNAAGCDSTVNVNLTFKASSVDIVSLDAPCEDAEGIAIIKSSTALGGNPLLYINDIKDEPITSFPKEILLKPGTYTLKLVDSDTCSASSEISIGSEEEPLVKIVETILPDGSKQLSFTSTKPLSSFEWNPLALVDCKECQLVNVIGFGTVELIYNYGDGCDGIVTYVVSKEIIKEIYFPTVINLNSISGNGTFFPNKPSDYDVKAASMAIFDRWGNQVFINRNFEIGVPENGWNGTFNGKMLQPGVYVYALTTIDADGLTKTYVGDITLIK
jgi:hypothetical protein